MRSSILTWLWTASFVTAQTTTAPVVAGPIQTLQCYSDPGTLKNYNTSTYQTDGLCRSTCVALDQPVMAITGGSTCYCGSLIPSLDKQVDSSKCNSPCNGFGTKSCGGIGYWQVYLDGISGDVQTSPNSTASASPSGSGPAQTVVVTQSASPSAAVAHGSSSVGIAVGVVVGVLVISAVIGGATFWYRRKRAQEIEEEHKQKEMVNRFVHSKGSDSLADSRLDQSVFSHRRESIGSIADEVDYSRRILQVRNPDRGSVLSAV